MSVRVNCMCVGLRLCVCVQGDVLFFNVVLYVWGALGCLLIGCWLLEGQAADVRFQPVRLWVCGCVCVHGGVAVLCS